MATTSDGKGKQIVVRVDDDLLEQLIDDARQNERTMAQTVRFHLRQQLRGQPA